MRRLFPIAVLILVFALVAILAWVSNHLDFFRSPRPANPVQSESELTPPEIPTASESLLTGYGDPATPPIDDLRKIQHVAVGYFSLVKDAQRFPIGGNEDFSAALRGANPNREVFIRPGNPIFSPAGLLLDRWGSPLIVHPQAWRELELRSAGPDRIPHTADDLLLSPAGSSSQAR